MEAMIMVSWSRTRPPISSRRIMEERWIFSSMLMRNNMDNSQSWVLAFPGPQVVDRRFKNASFSSLISDYRCANRYFATQVQVHYFRTVHNSDGCFCFCISVFDKILVCPTRFLERLITNTYLREMGNQANLCLQTQKYKFFNRDTSTRGNPGYPLVDEPL